jgi:hypothetical protein
MKFQVGLQGKLIQVIYVEEKLLFFMKKLLCYEISSGASGKNN